MRVIVLAYHRVYHSNHIDPETFDYQIKVLRENFTPLTLDDVLAFVKGELSLSKDGFAVTFDDGWADNFIYAYPILKKYKIKATLFVSPNFILNKSLVRPTLEDYWNGKVAYCDLFKGKDMNESIFEFVNKGSSHQFLSWDEINAMRQVFDIQSHGYSHAYQFISHKIVDFFGKKPIGRQNWLLLSGIDFVEGAPIYESGSALAYPRYYEDKRLHQDLINFFKKNYNYSYNKNLKRILNKKNKSCQNKDKYNGYIEDLVSYQRRVRNELEISIERINYYTGTIPKYIAWPFGEYSELAIKTAKELGFKACYTISQGDIRIGDNCYELKRFSPPRRRRVFTAAIQGNVGMYIFRGCVLAFSYLRNLKKF